MVVPKAEKIWKAIAACIRRCFAMVNHFDANTMVLIDRQAFEGNEGYT